MLTRSEVARRLGKSIATVRRMEGRELHPRRDGQGVHLFDPAEVDAVARRGCYAKGDTTTNAGLDWRDWLDREFAERDEPADTELEAGNDRADAETRLAAELRAEVEEERKRTLAQRRRADLAEALRRRQKERHQVELLMAEIIGLASSLSPREQRRLAKDAQFVQLLEGIAEW